MERVSFIPLGSVVLLDGGTQRLMVVARGLNVPRGERVFFFDYACVPYPQGLMNAELAYFNHDAIRSLSFIGCNDGDNQTIVESLNSYIDKHPELVRCTQEEWNEAQESDS